MIKTILKNDNLAAESSNDRGITQLEENPLDSDPWKGLLDDGR